MSKSSVEQTDVPAGPVLVVEDNDDVRAALSALLEVSGYHALGAENGLVALEMLHELRERPCLILLDLNMPVMNGIEFRERQLADPSASDIPVIVVSANDGAARGLSFDAVVRKPIDPSTLLTAIEQHYARAA